MPDKYPCFTVTDLSADERFKDLPFVTGPPKFRFYAGTCLRTKRGINIGSLFVIDDKVRPELTPSQVDLYVYVGVFPSPSVRSPELWTAFLEQLSDLSSRDMFQLINNYLIE